MSKDRKIYTEIDRLQNVVALGGGHGLGRLLSSLSFLNERLTGIVATTDNGGSTGRIRASQGGIAWGDIRNCLNQIVSTPTVASRLFEHRFAGQGELSGHNVGNLILKGLEELQIRPLAGINLVRRLLQVRPNLIPMSEQPAHLAAVLGSGDTVVGEVSVDQLEELPHTLLVQPTVDATPEALSVINKADLILLGPGSFFTSIMPTLLLNEMAAALQQSRAPIVLIDNIQLEVDMSGKLSLQQRIEWIERHIGGQRLSGVITTHNPLDTHSAFVLVSDLRADDISYRHDRDKLCHAINEWLARFHSR